MAVDYVAKYTLKFNNLAGRGLLSAGRMADALGKKLKNVTLAGARIATGMAVAMDRVNSALAEQVQLAKSVGSTHEELSAITNAAKALGFEYDNVVDLQEELANKVGEFKNLGEMTSLEEGLRGLNISAKEFVKLKPAEQMEALMIAAGKVDQQVAASAADMILGGEASKIFGALNAEIKNSGKTAEEYFARQKRLNMLTDEARNGAVRYTSAMRQLGIFTGSVVQEAFGRLGAILAPVLEKLTDFITANRELIATKVQDFIQRLSDKLNKIDFAELASKASEFKEALGDVVGRVGELIGKAGGLKTLVKVFAGLWALTALGKVAGAVLTVTTALKGLAVGIRVVAIALVANPIGLIIAGVATAAVGAFLLIRKHWDKIAPLVDRVTAWFMGMYEQAKPIIAAIGQVVVNVFGIISNVVRTHLEVVGRVMSAVWSGAQRVVSVSVTSIKSAVNLLKTPFTAVVGWGKVMGQGLNSVWSGLKDGATSMVNYIRDKINAVMDKLRAAAEAGARLRDKILAGLGNDAAQRRVEEREQRDRAQQTQRAREAGVTPQGGLNYMYGSLNSHAPTLVPAPETHLTVINEADGGVRVEKRVGNEGSTTNLPHQPNSRVTF